MFNDEWSFRAVQKVSPQNPVHGVQNGQLVCHILSYSQVVIVPKTISRPSNVHGIFQVIWLVSQLARDGLSSSVLNKQTVTAVLIVLFEIFHEYLISRIILRLDLTFLMLFSVFCKELKKLKSTRRKQNNGNFNHQFRLQNHSKRTFSSGPEGQNLQWTKWVYSNV